MSKNIFKILLLFLTLVLFACEKKEDKVSENTESIQTKFPTIFFSLMADFNILVYGSILVYTEEY